MTSILDQFENDLEATPTPEETVLPEVPEIVKKTRKPRVNKKLVIDESNPETEERREQLSILAVLGTISNYTGVKMSLGDVKKLPAKDVEKYFNRYQITLGNQVASGLIDTALEAGVTLVSYVLPIDDKQELCNDIKKDELVKQELINAAGLVVLKGGRFVALASGLIKIAKHIDFSSISKGKEDEIDKFIQDTVDKTLE